MAGHADHHDHHGHHHHPHRHHRPMRMGAARPDRPGLSLLTLSATARLGVATLMIGVIWTLIGWAVR